MGTDEFSRSDAVLRIIDVLESQGVRTSQPLLEGIAYLAKRPDYQQLNCRAITALQVDESCQNWALELRTALLSLSDSESVRVADGCYSLTRQGKQRAAELRTADSESFRDEDAYITVMMMQVREVLDR